MTNRTGTVLVVEDDLDLREMVELTLLSAGYRVMTASEGQEALDCVAQEMPGAIVLDMKMPGMNGWEFAHEFHARYSHRAPILVLTAAQAAQDQAREIRAEGFLDKPFDIDELIRAVGGLMLRPVQSAADEGPLVTLAQRGDHDAFMQLYDRYYDRIYRHLYYRVSRTEDAEDLTQQVFLKAWSALGRYEQRGSPFAAWIFTIAHNVLVNFYRARRDLSMTDAFPDVRPDSDPELLAGVHWERETLLQAILRLSPIQQKIISLRFVDGLSHDQVAAILGKTEINIRVIQFRALQALRRMLEGADRQ